MLRAALEEERKERENQSAAESMYADGLRARLVSAEADLAVERAQAAEQRLAQVEQETIERCAKIVRELPLTLDSHKYPSTTERHLIAVIEAGCRGAFTEAIRALKAAKD